MKIKKLHCCCICFFFMFAVLKVSAQAVIWSPDSPVNVKIFMESEKEAQLEEKMERWMYLNELAEQIAAQS